MNIVRRVSIVVVSLVIVVYVILPGGFGAYATLRHGRPPQGPGADPPKGFSRVALRAEDGIRIAGWYAPPADGLAVVLVHSAMASRWSVRAHARMLHSEGFGVLAIDLRGHGESGGKGNEFGWQCTRDVAAAVRYLQARDEVRAIGALGLSMGGEVLLGAAGSLPGIRAIVAEGATERSLADYIVFPDQRGLVHSWTVRVMYAAVRLFSGEAPPVPIISSVGKATTTDFLFIAAGNVAKEARYSRRFAAVAAGRSQVWVVPGVGHTQGYAKVPSEYEARVIEFLRRSL